LASYYNKKVYTERLIVIGGTKDEPKANTLTKDTILN